MYIRKSHAKSLKTPFEAYCLLCLDVVLVLMLFFGYQNATWDVLLVCLLVIVGVAVEFCRLMYVREKTLTVIAKRRERSIYLRKISRNTQSFS